mmetsp:Transcript_3283/g.5290  ORF Transcript_3283/g.5290 Transcript_3283/m.5290 type:complete len:221 (+) Transcript_3283:690-1352(+)
MPQRLCSLSTTLRTSTRRSRVGGSCLSSSTLLSAGPEWPHLNTCSFCLQTCLTKTLTPELETRLDHHESQGLSCGCPLKPPAHIRKCFAVMGKFHELAKSHSQDKVAFAQVACDQVKEIAESAGVSKVPTFQVYLNGEKVDELVGEHSTSVLSKKVKAMVTSWVDEHHLESSSIESQAESVVGEYSPVTAERDADGDDFEFSAPPEGMECGADGCEIKWD